MTSYTDTTQEIGFTGEGKRNKKVQLLSSLLSASALGVFLAGCASSDSTPPPVVGSGFVQEGTNLYFGGAKGFGDFSFTRESESVGGGEANPDILFITVGGEKETIEIFVDNTLTLYYGSPDTGKELGKLYVGTESLDRDLIGTADDDVLVGLDGIDIIKGGAGNDILSGDEGNDQLDGGEGKDTYVFRVGDGTDTIDDVAGDTIILRFEGSSYGAGDFTDTVFSRVSDDLVITLNNDGITDKITINDAYDDDPNIGKDNAAFTIDIQYGEGGTFTQVVDIWSGLT